MIRALSLAVVVLALMPACGGDEPEELLVPDQEIDDTTLESRADALTSTPAPGPAVDGPHAAHLRLAWGYLSGKPLASDWVNWSGALTVGSGTAALEHLVFFDRRDHLRPSGSGGTLSWESRTRPHLDGFVARVEASPSALVVVDTPRFKKAFTLAELEAGVEERVVVDTDLHEVSVSSIAANRCGGFAYGYERRARQGWLAFGGRMTDASGNVIGRLRFRSDDGQLTARLLDDAKNVLGTGTGRLEHGKLTLALKKPDGSELAEVSGLFFPPTYSRRGNFQATFRCP